MIDPSLYAAFVAATAILMLIPGPNVALIVANSVASGARYGLLTVAGTASAMVVQLALTALGHGGGLDRWASPSSGSAGSASPISSCSASASGARRRSILLRIHAQPRSARRIWSRGFLVSLTNPKTLLFYGAFFPQFITPSAPAGPQVALLATTCVVVAVVIDSGWALAASRARRVLATRGRLRNRVSGGLMFGAGLGLALARHK